MTTYFVNSNGGAPSSPYANWTDAAASIVDAITAGAASGDIIKVHTGTTPHAEVYSSATIIITGPVADGPLTIIGVDKDDSDVYLDHSGSSNYEVTTTTGAYDIIFNQSVVVYGLWFYSNDDIGFYSEKEEFQYYQDCKLKTIGTLGEDINGPSTRITFKNCIFDTGSAGVISCGAGRWELINPTLISSHNTAMFYTPFSGTNLDLIGADLSSLNCLYIFQLWINEWSDIKIIGSILHATNELAYFDDATTSRLTVSGSDTAAGNNQWRHETLQGSYLASSNLADSVYRDSAATYDGTNEYSLAFDSGSVNHIDAPFYSDWNSIYVAAADGKNVKVYVAHTAQLKNDDIWIEVEYFSATANTLKTVVSSRVATILDTPADLANATGESWTGIAAYNSDTGQYCTLGSTIDIKKSGMLRWRIGYAGVSSSGATIYVCPKIEIV